ncbi:MAG TPA: hypothetical protein VKZ65_00885 [Glycomyces sp.]|nr:hypothetical protein [Glycomyces sp.]
MTYPPPGANPPPPGYGQQPQQPGYPPQQGGPVPPPPPGQQPGYPPPQQPGGYGAPPPPMPPAGGSKGGGVLGKILGAVGAVVLVGVVIAIRAFAGGSDDTDPNNDTLDREQMKAAETAEVGDCMADALSSATDDLVVDCDDPNAFWTITEVSDDSGAEVDIMGELTDPQLVVDICGQAYMGWEIGQLWKSYQYVYTEQTQGLGGPVDYLYCVEAIDKQDERGRTPKVPDTGECLNDDQGFWTVDCSSTEALYEVLNTQSYDPPAEMTETELQSELGGCAESSSFYPYGLYGVDDLVYGAMCIDYAS